MRARVVIFAYIATICLAGENSALRREVTEQLRREQERHKKFASEPTPEEWRSGAVWRFVMTPRAAEAKPDTLTLRITDKPSHNCLADANWKSAWRKFVVLDGHVPMGPPIYQIEGRALQINLNGSWCDDYDIIDGVLTGAIL
jgi:hypothetical protein